jgi:hypothetical protein
MCHPGGLLQRQGCRHRPVVSGTRMVEGGQVPFGAVATHHLNPPLGCLAPPAHTALYPYGCPATGTAMS